MVGRARLGSTNAGTSLWNAAVERLRDSLSVEARSRVDALQLLRPEPSTLRVGAPLSTLQDLARDGSLDALERALEATSDGRCALAVVPFDAGSRPSTLDPTFTLERFIAGPSNHFARLAADSLLGNRSAQRALFVVGPRQSGKTHFLQALGHALENTAENGGVLYRSARDFTNDVISAILSSGLPELRNRCRGCTALLLDDCADLAEAEATQSELAELLDALGEAGAPVVLAGPAKPAELRGVSDALRSRVQDAALLELSPPEWETRVAIVLDHARRWQLELTPDVAAHVVSYAGPELWKIDVALTRLVSRGTTARRDVDSARAAIEGARPRANRVPAGAVVALVARQHNLRIRDLRSDARSRRVTLPRQIAMYLLRNLSQLSYPEIGRRFDRHHTTALHSCRRIERMQGRDETLRARLRELERELLRPNDGG